jgi:AraC family transcriptional activator of pobA
MKTSDIAASVGVIILLAAFLLNMYNSIFAMTIFYCNRIYYYYHYPATMKSSDKLHLETEIKDSFFIDRLKHVPLHKEYSERLSYHRIFLIVNGVGSLIIDENRFDISSSELFLIAKGQVCAFDTNAIVTGYVLHFGDCFWEKAPASASNCKAVLFNNAAANQHISLKKAEFSELNLLFGILFNEFDMSPYANRLDALAAYLKIIMIKVANVKLTDDSLFDNQDYVLYRNFMELLSAQFREYHEVGDYARMLGITARRLSDLCKRCSHKTSKELISGQLIAEAKRALQFSSRPIKEIAYQLNFNSPEQFSHFFKKNTNISPASYRHHFINIGGGDFIGKA